MVNPEPRELPTALPHGEIREVFSDIFFVTGTSRPTFMGERWQFSRNMVVVRQGDSLTLINTVRLSDDGLKQLDALGRVRHIVRLGAFHGRDDAFYQHRYEADLWALSGTSDEHGATVNRSLSEALPITDASLFVWESAKAPEAMLLLAREGGVLISCDSLQNWEGPDEWFDAPSIDRMRAMGFFRSANVGPGWRGAAQPSVEDFARVEALAFQHLLSAHGTPLLEVAHARVTDTLRMLRES